MKIVVFSVLGVFLVVAIGWWNGVGYGESKIIGDKTVNVVRDNNRVMMDDKVNEVVAEDYVSARPAVVAFPVEELSQVEKDNLTYMREEEKLARDVYMTLYEKWNLPIFSNIAQSEQTHTEAVRTLLVKYNLTDPVQDDTIGSFTNDNLLSLYNELAKQGSVSLEAALGVGATIEDLDIKDLQKAIRENDNEDVAFVYENLMRGSRNHLRSFNSQLLLRNVTYKPQYISASEFETITNQDKETGSGSGRGRNKGRGWGG